MIVTSGGLGPTADDLTAEVVGRFSGREMVLDPGARGADRGDPRGADAALAGPRPGGDPSPNRKQAMIPRGATVLDPVGTAPGLVVPPARRAPGPTVVVLPGPPRELQPMWETAAETDAFKAAIAGATEYRRGILRLFGIPESEIANTLRAAEADGLELEPLEITTCLRRGEIEVSTRYEPAAEAAYEALADFVAARHATRCSPTTARLSTSRSRRCWTAHRGRRRVVHRRADVGAADRAPRAPLRTSLGGRRRVLERGKGRARRGRRALIERFGAVSTEVAEALADGAAEHFDADFGVGITGIAGPDGGTEEKPAGTRVLLGLRAARDADHALDAASRGPRRRPRPLDDRRDAPPAQAAGRRGGRGPARGTDAGARRAAMNRRARAAVRRARAAGRGARCARRMAHLGARPQRAAARLPRRPPRDAVLPRLVRLGAGRRDRAGRARRCAAPARLCSRSPSPWRCHPAAPACSRSRSRISRVASARFRRRPRRRFGPVAGMSPRQPPFLGHVTVARAGRGARIPRVALVAAPVPELRFEGSELVLYRSHLGRDGAR